MAHLVGQGVLLQPTPTFGGWQAAPHACQSIDEAPQGQEPGVIAGLSEPKSVFRHAQKGPAEAG